MGSAAAAGEPYRGDDRRGAPDGLVRRCLGRQQPQRLQARGEGDARRLAGQKGMIKTGRRGGADDNAAISTCCGHRNQREEPSLADNSAARRASEILAKLSVSNTIVSLVPIGTLKTPARLTLYNPFQHA